MELISFKYHLQFLINVHPQVHSIFNSLDQHYFKIFPTISTNLAKSIE